MPRPIPHVPFGRTGHASSRVVFGAAALMADNPKVNDRALALLLEHGIDHIDVAASYGKAEDAVGRWMPEHRDRFFLATKTGERGYEGARSEIRRSLERLRTDRIDLIQLHNLREPAERDLAFSDDGAVRACVEARDEGLVRFIGVTGHGLGIAHAHLDSLERFPFDAVLLPYNWPVLQQGAYADDFERLARVCRERGVAVQTIKAVARRRWQDPARATRRCWYEPIEEPDAFERAVHFVLRRPDVFLNTSSDLAILERTIAAAERFDPSATAARTAEADAALADALTAIDARSLFEPGLDDPILPAA